MKLGTLKNNQRDGQLVVVSEDLTRAITVSTIAETLQEALDNWRTLSSQLAEIYRELNSNSASGFLLKIDKLASPLPRAYQWLDGSVYLNHAELLAQARGEPLPELVYKEPAMYQGVSDNLLDPIAHVKFEEAWGVDYEAEVVVVTDDVPMGISKSEAANKILLVGLVNDISLRNLIPQELSKRFGFLQSKPANSFSPVFVTPDSLGNYWNESKLHLPVKSFINDKLMGQPNAGVDMFFDFADLIVHAAKTRNLSAGTIIGSGTVSNYDPRAGVSCLAELRTKETIQYGAAKTPYLKAGDAVRIEVLDPENRTVFGAIQNYFAKNSA